MFIRLQSKCRLCNQMTAFSLHCNANIGN
jgi:hypothetical protein